MFWFWSRHLVYNLSNFPSLLIMFPILFHNPLNVTWITTSFNCKYPSICVHTSYQCYMCLPFISPWQWVHGHPWCKLWHFCYYCMRCRLPCGMKTIAPTSFNHISLLSLTNWHYVHQIWNSHPSWCCHCQSNMSKFISLILCNWKICYFWNSQKKSYFDWHLTNHFIFLTIEVFGCLNKQVDMFLHDCANAMWNFKRPKGPPFSMLVIFFRQKISITLQTHHYG